MDDQYNRDVAKVMIFLIALVMVIFGVALLWGVRAVGWILFSVGVTGIVYSGRTKP